MSKATRIKQAIRITVISTLVFYFGLIALLNLPAVQHRRCGGGHRGQHRQGVHLQRRDPLGPALSAGL